MVIDNTFTYVDLFAGIGGFHNAMTKFSDKSKCIMACEIDENARNVYKDNFDMVPLGDIRKIKPKDVGAFDVLCAGFPCQTFSKAGKQEGFGDPRGTLFYEIIRLIKFRKRIADRPKILILENVHNLVRHDGGKTWRTIKDTIRKTGYNVVEEPIVIGPKDLGIPQIRDRAIILAVRKDIYNGPITIDFKQKDRNTTSIYSIIDERISEDEFKEYSLTQKQIKLLDCWDDFYHGIKEKVLGTPVWSDEFGKNYDLTVRDEDGNFIIPEWKQRYIQWNRDLYLNNKEFIDSWYARWDIKSWTFATDRKFEWQCGKFNRSVWEGIIQFRTSGIRVKRPTESPTLVTLNHAPAIGSQRRFITVKEAARLQSFPENFVFNEPKNEAFKQLGNAVNVDVIEFMFRKFVSFLEEKDNGNKES